MKCTTCGKETGNDEQWICTDCAIKELLWVYRDNPNVYLDTIFVKQADGTIVEKQIIRGLKFKD